MPNLAKVVEAPTEEDPLALKTVYNRLEPEPFSVLLEPMIGREWADCLRRIGTDSLGSRSDGGAVSRGIEARDQTLKLRVREVRNFEVEARDGTRVYRPSNGEELVEAVYEGYGNLASEVLDDIYTALISISELKRGLSDRLSSLHKSATADAASYSDGAVADADDPTPQDPR